MNRPDVYAHLRRSFDQLGAQMLFGLCSQQGFSGASWCMQRRPLHSSVGNSCICKCSNRAGMRIITPSTRSGCNGIYLSRYPACVFGNLGPRPNLIYIVFNVTNFMHIAVNWCPAGDGIFPRNWIVPSQAEAQSPRLALGILPGHLPSSSTAQNFMKVKAEYPQYHNLHHNASYAQDMTVSRRGHAFRDGYKLPPIKRWE